MTGRFAHGWGLVAQLVGSALTVLLTVWGARALSPSEFGVLALGGTVAMFAAGLGRTVSAEPLLFRYGFGPISRDALLTSASAFTVYVLVSSSLVGLIAAIFVDFYLSLCVTWLSAALTLLEHQRLLLIGRRRTRSAAVADAAGFGLAAALLATLQTEGLQTLMAVWALAVTVSVILTVRTVPLSMQPRYATAWLKAEGRATLGFGTDFVVSVGVAQGAIACAAVFDGIEASGALRGAYTLLIPVTVVTRSVATSIAPVIVTSVQGQRHSKAHLVTAGFALASVVSAGTTVLVGLALPLAWWEQLLGESATASRELFPWAALAAGLMGLSMSPGLLLRAFGHIWESARLRLSLAPATLAAMVFGTIAIGVEATQIALAAQHLLRAGGNIRQVRRIERASQ